VLSFSPYPSATSVGDRHEPVSPATFDEHEGDTFTEHRFVNVLSSPCSSW